MKPTAITEKLLEAREYEVRHSKEIPNDQRPVFHMYTPVGWMNDPNGFSMFKGSCHLFFQYHPYSIFWGPMAVAIASGLIVATVLTLLVLPVMYVTIYKIKRSVS